MCVQFCVLIDDASRVELTKIDEDPSTDYINASYIDVSLHTMHHVVIITEIEITGGH